MLEKGFITQLNKITGKPYISIGQPQINYRD